MSTPYNAAFACFACCKSFKREFNLAESYPLELVCPNCGGEAYNFGRNFKAPKITDKKQWAKLKFLFDHGFRFQAVYEVKEDTGHYKVSYPKTLDEAKEFVVKFKQQALNNPL